MRALEFHQDSLAPAQWTGLDSNFLANFQIGPRLAWNAGSDQRLNGFELGFFQRNGLAAIANNLNNTGRLQNRQPVLRIKSAKQISRKKWRFGFYGAIRPTRPSLVQRQEILVTHSLKMGRHTSFVARAHVQSGPGQTTRRACRGAAIVIEFCGHAHETFFSTKLPPLESQGGSIPNTVSCAQELPQSAPWVFSLSC